MNKNKDDEVIQSDEGVEILVRIENNCIRVSEMILRDSDLGVISRLYVTFFVSIFIETLFLVC